MEEFIEIFIYLLITIVILVLSMRKKKTVEPESEESSQTGDPFSELFKEDAEYEEDYGKGPQPATVSNQEVQPAKASGQESPWMSKTEASDMLMDSDAVIKEAKENNPIAQYEGKVKEDAYGIGMSYEEGIPFDLKKAVIYSEILNRKIY